MVATLVSHCFGVGMTFQSSKGHVTYLMTLKRLKVIIRATILKILAPETTSTCLRTLTSMVDIPLWQKPPVRELILFKQAMEISTL